MEKFLMADIFGGFSCICSAGYLELRGALLFVWGTSNCAGYLKSHRVPQIMLESFHLSTRGVLLSFLFFS